MKVIINSEPGGPEQLVFQDWPDPRPKAHQLLVEVAATALNRADILQRRGMYPPPDGESPVLGLEMAGVVREVGPGVTKWKPGDRVCGLLGGGGYASLAVIHEDMALPVPARLSLEEAAGIPEVFLTAYQALVWLADLKEGERILIHAGASGVGTAAIQLAGTLGARSLVTASAPKHAVCLELGASHAIDYKSKDFKTAVLRLTEDKGVDVVIDFIGAPYFQRNLQVLRTDGRLVILGLMGGVQPESVNLAPVLRKRLRVIGSTLRARSLEYKIALTEDFRQFAWARLESGQLRPIIDTVFDWTEVAEAHRYMEANKNRGKIVMRVR